MRHSIASILVCLGLMACQRHSTPPAPAAKPPSYTSQEECKFAVGNAAGTFCQAPFAALLSDPQRFEGKRIFTYAYIWRLPKPDEGFTITLQSSPRRTPDFASCVIVKSQVKGDDIDLEKMERGSAYSIALGGTFKRNIGQFLCIGTLENIDIQYLFKES